MSRKCLLDCSASGAKWADDVQLILLTPRSLATSDRDRQAFFPDQLVQVVGLLL